MAYPAGESNGGALRLDFDRRPSNSDGEARLNQINAIVHDATAELLNLEDKTAENIDRIAKKYFDQFNLPERQTMVDLGALIDQAFGRGVGFSGLMIPAFASFHSTELAPDCLRARKLHDIRVGFAPFLDSGKIVHDVQEGWPVGLFQDFP